MKARAWVIVAFLGLAVMGAAYASRERIDSKATWASGLIVISPEASPEKAGFRDAIPARIRLLTSSQIAEMLLFATGDSVPDRALDIKGRVRVKLIELPLTSSGIGATEVQSGRLPEPGQNEILAGAQVEPRETLIVGGKSLKVVGVLKPELALFAESYLIPTEVISTSATDGLFPSAVPSVFHGWVVRASAEELINEDFQKVLRETFPTKKFAWISPRDQLEPRTFYLYVSGLAILLLGGSGSLIGLFSWLADKAGELVSAPSQGSAEPMLERSGPVKLTMAFLAAPLLEMKTRPRLVWTVHLVYFGIVIVSSLITYQVAEAQVVLLGKVREALSTSGNPLGVAGVAYQSGNIPLAAAVTFGINFVLGSLLMITLPSILLPGSGILVAGVRAMAWGLILAPVVQSLAYAMLPHSLTMLLEGEGYILATLFGLLIPIHIIRARLGGNPLTRFGQVLLLNLKANFWIASVLAVAAIYEAIEVILMNR